MHPVALLTSQPYKPSVGTTRSVKSIYDVKRVFELMTSVAQH